MFSTIVLSLVLASGVSAPQKSIQTIRTAADGTTTVEGRVVDAATATVRATEAGGRVVVATLGSERRVLIEIRERAKLDRNRPGSAAVASLQRQQLTRDLAALDTRLHTRTPSRITRQYETLFAGVAATVDPVAIAEIRRLPNVMAVREDVEVRANLTESVPLIGATAVAATYGVTGAGVRVAVIDTGIDYTHPDLGGCLGVACKVVDGYDFVNGDDDPRDDHGHGTHVAGIIAANGTLKGVAPGATLLAYKVLNSGGSGWTSDIIAGLEQAVLDGADVANLSLGGSGDPDDPTSQAIDNATAAGMLSVVAAGNFGPSYQTVDSPGVARTALTVGATDKSWQMAYFSARGPVADGDHLLMKPEVVAPGVDILSTVPTTGALGDPSGYKLLSGTSMATPHVAGSAALLLQWNHSQTPAELKSRLVSSARPITGDLFSTGAGGIDLVAAFAAHSIPTTTSASFGLVDQASGVVVREQIVSLRNTGVTAETLSFGIGSPLPAGATLQILPSSATLQPGASVDVTLRLEIDAAVVPDPAEPLAWSTNIVVTGGAQAVKVPAYFFKASRLTLSFDVAPYAVYLVSPSTVRSFYNLGTSLSSIVKPGLWDVLTLYMENPTTIVVKEQQDVQQATTLNIARSQATRTATFHAVDDAGQPLDDLAFSRDVQLQIANFGMGVGSLNDFRLSALSTRYDVALAGSGPDPSGQRFFISSWVGKGYSSDVTLPRAGVPFRRLAQATAQPAGAAPATMVNHLGFALKFESGMGFAILWGSIRPGVLSQTFYMQSTSATPDPSMRHVEQTILMDPTNFDRMIYGSYLHPKDNSDVEVSHWAFFDLFDPADVPDVVLSPAVERWDLDTAPHALPLQFSNEDSVIRAYGIGMPRWMTHTLSTMALVSGAEPVFGLYRNGVLVDNYTFNNLGEGFLAQPGPYEIRSTSDYAINSVPGSSRAAISFDTTRFDPNPPFVTRFRIEQNSVRTPTPAFPAPNAIPAVKFRVVDNFQVNGVTLEWRTNGTTTWTSLPLSQTGWDYDAPLNHQGSIDLRLTAVDSAGNTFQEEWTPAVIATAATPPSPPASLAATRTGTSKISLSWMPAPSQVGIAGYRIERLPDHVIANTTGTGTTFADANGLVSGNAYFYRVYAIDTNNAMSTPTAYDVATLIDLHDDPVLPGVTPMRGIHVADLRRAIDAIRHAAGLGSAWPNYNAPTGVIAASHFLALRDRLNEARSVMQLPNVQFPQTVAPGATIRASDLEKLRDGVK